ncbi:MAG TPA: hypothetical protein VHS97_20620 [Isosphaeraceae bacterium]|jgi:hypothetical protein|nr:hypothetical protein [Isosphaeraceae bacterium]
MLERFAATDDAVIAERTAKACLLMRAGPLELNQACQLAERAVEMAYPELVKHAELARGLAEYRRGRLAESIRWMDRSLAWESRRWSIEVPAHLVQAMAHLRLANITAARAARAKAAAVAKEQMPKIGRDAVGPEWHEWAICTVLQREADALFLDLDFPVDPFGR